MSCVWQQRGSGVVISAPGKVNWRSDLLKMYCLFFKEEMAVCLCSEAKALVQRKPSHRHRELCTFAFLLLKPNPLNQKKKKRKEILLTHFPPMCIQIPLYLPVTMQMWPTGTRSAADVAAWLDSLWLKSCSHSDESGAR